MNTEFELALCKKFNEIFPSKCHLKNNFSCVIKDEYWFCWAQIEIKSGDHSLAGEYDNYLITVITDYLMIEHSYFIEGSGEHRGTLSLRYHLKGSIDENVEGICELIDHKTKYLRIPLMESKILH